MSNHEDCLSQTQERFGQHACGSVVEFSRGFVQQQDFRFGHEGSSDCRTLPLAETEPRCGAGRTKFEFGIAQDCVGLGFGLLPFHTIVNEWKG